MNMNPPLRRALAIGAVLASVLAVCVSPAHGEPVRAQAVTATASDALDWLEGQFAANGHHLVSGFSDENGFQTFPDIGLSIDGILALRAGGRDNAEVHAAVAYVVDSTDDYVTGSTPGALAAGAVGKSLLVALVAHYDPTDVDGHDLEADLRSLLTPSGRFSDKGFTDFQTHEPVDYSNGIGQAIDMLALGGTEEGVPASALGYLKLQQCPNGGFRVILGSAQCSNNGEADVDATAFALQALLVSGEESEVHDAGVHALQYLLREQGDDGSWVDGNANANSTGLAASTLRGFGDNPDANTAASFVKAIQLTSGDDAGAITLNKEQFDDASANGVSDEMRPTVVRATTQGVLALGLPAYLFIGVFEPVEPATTIALSSSSAKPGDTVTVDGNGFYADEVVDVILHSDPETVASPTADEQGRPSTTFTVPQSTPPGSHTVELRGQTSGVTISAPLTVAATDGSTTTTTVTSSSSSSTSSTSTTSTTIGATTSSIPPTSSGVLVTGLVRTGSDTGAQLLVSTALMVLGAALFASTRRRRIVYPFKR
jgi:hypothetical protein